MGMTEMTYPSLAFFEITPIKNAALKGTLKTEPFSKLKSTDLYCFTKLLLCKCHFGNLPWVQSSLMNTAGRHTVFHSHFTRGLDQFFFFTVRRPL